jgi:hypothetical protein
VRAIFLALVCDKPAAHKVAGFGPPGHRYFCHRCWVEQQDLRTPKAFANQGKLGYAVALIDNNTISAFRYRTDAQHRELGAKFQQICDPKQQENFVKEHSTRFTQLSRLPYFDIIRQVVIDPMHCLALGTITIACFIQCLMWRRSHQNAVLPHLGSAKDLERARTSRASPITHVGAQVRLNICFYS